MNFEQFIDWSYLGTFAGVVTVVSLIVQLTKGLVDKSPLKMPTQLYSYMIAVVVIWLVEIFGAGGDGLTLSEAVLSFFNGLIVSVASNGSYDMIKKVLEEDEDV